VYDVASMDKLLDRSLTWQRSREIGIRVALGASLAEVLKLIVAKGVILASIGIVAGAFIAAAAASMLGSLLYGVRPQDPGVFLVVSVVLFSVAILASYLPARRARWRISGDHLLVI
jgi:ABC-type antimicrobial peptide transport system permease subunit